MTDNPTIRGAAVVAVATIAGIAVWAVVRLAGIDLDLKESASSDEVRGIDVVIASLLGGIAAWGVYALLGRLHRERFWPFVGTTALAVSMIGPSWFADGSSAAALIAMHVAVGIVLIAGFGVFVNGHRHAQHESDQLRAEARPLRSSDHRATH
jgi:hypothetical protein